MVDVVVPFCACPTSPQSPEGSMRPTFNSLESFHHAVSFSIEQLERRCLLAAAMEGLLDPLLVPKFVSAMPNALDPSFIFQRSAAITTTLACTRLRRIWGSA